jgi:membrane protein DedA with SNARE-associated domain
MLIAFIGSFAGDQLYYFIGYFKGRELVSKHPAWERRIVRIYKLVERYSNLIILGFRFVYGMRIMTPFGLGMCRDVKTSRFVILNAAGAAIWAITIATGGYFFGYALQPFIKNIRRYELYAIIAVAFIGICLWILHLYRKKRLKDTNQPLI